VPPTSLAAVPVSVAVSWPRDAATVTALPFAGLAAMVPQANGGSPGDGATVVGPVVGGVVVSKVELEVEGAAGEVVVCE
jgi:hypothetical protein